MAVTPDHINVFVVTTPVRRLDIKGPAGNPFQDRDSLEALEWRYHYDPVFHALLFVDDDCHASPEMFVWTARRVQRTLDLIDKAGLMVVQA